MVLQNVTIGMRRFSDDEADPGSYPTIGDDVTISSGAAILGGVRIGSATMIGANAVVLADIPDGRVAVGAPARCVAINDGALTC
jgi:serine acetyltransferase